jgi:hypothetical protein
MQFFFIDIEKKIIRNEVFRAEIGIPNVNGNRREMISCLAM